MTVVRISEQLACDGGGRLLRLECAEQPQLMELPPGSRLLSDSGEARIMRRSTTTARLDVLFYPQAGLPEDCAVAQKEFSFEVETQDAVSLPQEPDSKPLLITAAGAAVAVACDLSQQLRLKKQPPRLVILEAGEHPFPFTPIPSQILIPDMPAGVIATMPQLEEWQIACRLCAQEERPGCYPGDIKQLLKNVADDRYTIFELK